MSTFSIELCAHWNLKWNCTYRILADSQHDSYTVSLDAVRTLILIGYFAILENKITTYWKSLSRANLANASIFDWTWQKPSYIEIKRRRKSSGHPVFGEKTELIAHHPALIMSLFLTLNARLVALNAVTPLAAISAVHSIGISLPDMIWLIFKSFWTQRLMYLSEHSWRRDLNN